MQFSRSVVDVIRSRSSCRTYTARPLADEVKNRLTGFLQEKKSSPMEGKARFELIEMPELDSSEKKRLGTYGFIKGASYFIVGAMEQSTYSVENFGYLLEEIVLLATDLGLGTCWLGGTFKRSAFGERISAAPGETVPAITPVGYRAGQRLAEKVIKWSVKATKRKPWSGLFFKGDIDEPLTEKSAGDYALPLEMVRLAPSAANAQPWRIVKEVDNDVFHFFIKLKKRKLTGSRSLLIFPDMSRLDIGIALCHFELTARELDLKGTWNHDRQVENTSDHLRYVVTWTGK